MNLAELEAAFSQLGEKYKTKDVDRLNRRLIKNREDVSFLRELVLSQQQYHRTYFQISLAQKATVEEQFQFIEDNFALLQDWWHVDQLTQFIDKNLPFDFALEKAKQYVQREQPFVRRWAYVLFMPRLVKEPQAAESLFALFRDDDAYYVQMAEAWLLSYLAIYHSQATLSYLENCPLQYNIAGKAIQKICDAYRIGDKEKACFRELRRRYR